MDLEFARPDFLYLLLAVPVWLVLVWPWAGTGVLFTRGDSARRFSGRWGVRSAIVSLLPRFLRAGTLICVMVVLAQPERVEVTETTALRGGGLGLAVDLSSSMLAEDMGDGASRLDVARTAAMRFAANRRLDEMSLVGFGADAVTRMPPTIDPNLVAAGIGSLEVQLVRDGTDISGALLTSLARLLDSEREPRTVILVTDGAHNGTGVRPLEAARAAAALGVKVHAISVLPPEDPARTAARRAAYAGLNPGEEMRTVLAGIASLTGGQYFHAASAAALDSIYGEIDRIEAPVEVVTQQRLQIPSHTGFLIAALLLLGLELLLRGTRWGVVP